MTTSNSKLTQTEKDFLKDYLKPCYPNVKFYTIGRVTFAYEITGKKMMNISWSIASKDEKKLRAKVGQYFALARFDEEIYLPMEYDNGFLYFIRQLENLAEILCAEC